MKVSDVRSTLYLLLQSIESDLRYFIKNYLMPEHEGLSFLHSSELIKKVEDRFRNEFTGLLPNENREEAIDFLDFMDAFEVLMANTKFLPHGAKRELKTYSELFQKIAGTRNRVMHGRPLMAGDYIDVHAFVIDAVNTGALRWSACKNTLDQLERDPAFACGISVPFIEIPDAPCHNLPMPEFDDTGFIGRSKDIIDVKKLIMSRNSVITVIGEGGIGKTALMVKVLYDIVDMGGSCPYDYIIWVSSKTNILTSAGVQSIHNAISTFEGVISTISDKIGNSTRDAVSQQKEIIEAAKEVPMLIALDNLESIMGDDIREFIRELQEYAKIIITSRIGLGELEYRRQLMPFQKTEAVTLLRHTAHLTNTELLYNLPEKTILKYNEELFCNPLSIKWFVHCVASGRSPSEVLSNKKFLLEYCMSNVYDKLSPKERSVLESLLSARQPLSEAEISYFTSIEPLNVRRSLNFLLATSFIARSFTRKHDIEECLYEVIPFAREYLIRTYPPSKQMVSNILTKRKELTGALAENAATEERDPYSVNVITARSIAEQVSARSLRRALILTRKKDLSEALDIVEDVIKGHPSYFEAYRISAFIKTLQGNLIGANDDYGKAVELEPSNPRLLHFLAGFHLRFFEDPVEAAKYQERAIEADPESPVLRQQYARCQGYQGKHQEAIDILNDILVTPSGELTQKHKCIIYTQIIDFYRRIAETAISIEKDTVKACEAIYSGIKVFEVATSLNIYDQKEIDKFSSLIFEYKTIIRKANILEESTKYDLCLEKFKHFLSRSKFSADFYPMADLPENTSFFCNSSNDYISGEVIEHYNNKSFAFIQFFDGERYFFHRNNLEVPEEWNHIANGSLVEFKLGKNHKGTCAVSVHLLT